MEAFNPFAPKGLPAAKMSGMEIMLKNMGLGEVIDAAKMLASSDTIGKILLFADQLPEINRKLDILVLAELKRQGVVVNAQVGGADSITEEVNADLTGGTIRSADAEPDAGPAAGGEPAAPVAGLLDGDGSDNGDRKSVV